MKHENCITCRRIEFERQAQVRAENRADLINLLALIIGVAFVCALAWVLR